MHAASINDQSKLVVQTVVPIFSRNCSYNLDSILNKLSIIVVLVVLTVCATIGTSLINEVNFALFFMELIML